MLAGGKNRRVCPHVTRCGTTAQRRSGWAAGVGGESISGAGPVVPLHHTIQGGDSASPKGERAALCTLALRQMRRPASATTPILSRPARPPRAAAAVEDPFSPLRCHSPVLCCVAVAYLRSLLLSLASPQPACPGRQAPPARWLCPLVIPSFEAAWPTSSVSASPRSLLACLFTCACCEPPAAAGGASAARWSRLTLAVLALYPHRRSATRRASA